jgi:hypothetical protein
MKPYSAAIAAFGIAATLVASAASARDQFKIDAPAGWTKSAGSGPVLALWGEPNPAGFRQNITLMAEPFAGTVSDYVAAQRASDKQTIPGIVFGPEADVMTCGNHPAHFLSFKSASGERHMVFEQVFSVWFNRGYVLTYAREKGQASIDDARAALTSLCVRHEGD